MILSVLAATIFGAQAAINIPQQPNPPRLVNDFAHLLQANEQDALEQKLKDFSDSTSTQITVVIIDSLRGYAIEDYALEILRQWGVGQKGKNNGCVFLVAMADHLFRIENGYGLEGALPDGVCRLIELHEVTPSFKKGNFYEGIDNGTTAIMQATKVEYKADATENATPKKFPALAIVLIIIVLIIIFSRNNRGGNGGTLINGGGFGGFILGSALGGGGFSSSGGSDLGGGGFGGFGGGSGGGGGATGSW